MLKFKSIIIFLFVFISCQSQESNSQKIKGFINDIEHKRDARLLLDTISNLPMGVGLSRSMLYMEMKYVNQDSAYFVIDSYIEKLEGGSLQFSKSTSENANNYIKKQLNYFSKSFNGNFSFTISSSDFHESQNIMFGKTKSPYTSLSSLITKLLAGEQMKHLRVLKSVENNYDAQLIKAANGNWMINLRGKLEGKKYSTLGKDHELHYVKCGSEYLYPPKEIPEWKRNQVIKGNIPVGIQYASNSFSNNTTSISEFQHEEKQYDWSVIINVETKDFVAKDRIEAAGAVNLQVVSDEVVSHSLQVAMYLGKYTFDCDGNTIKILHATDGGIIGSKNLPWKKIVIKDEMNKVLHTFIKGEKSKVDLEKEERKGLFTEIFINKHEEILIPFDVDLLISEAHTPDLNDEVLVMKRYSVKNAESLYDVNQGVRAKYEFRLPEEQSITNMRLSKIVDNNGRNILERQGKLIDEINQANIDAGKRERVGAVHLKGFLFNYDDFENQKRVYNLDIILFENIRSDVDEIIIEGDYDLIVRDVYGPTKIKFVDTIRLDGLATSNTGGNIVEQKGDFLKPNYVQLSSVSDSPSWMGLRAEYSLDIKEESLHFVKLNREKSKVEFLTDNRGCDLIDGHRQQFEKRIMFYKMNRNYRTDSEINDPNLIHSVYQRDPEGGKIKFAVWGYDGLSKGSTYARGKAKITYLGYNKDEEQTASLPLNVINNLVEYSVERTTFQFEKSSFDETSTDQVEYFKYNVTTESNDLFIKSFVVKNENGEIVSLPDSKRWGIYDNKAITINKNAPLEKLQIEINYYKLGEFLTEVDFEMSMDVNQ